MRLVPGGANVIELLLFCVFGIASGLEGYAVKGLKKFDGNINTRILPDR
jgi:hypothetical protein